MMLKKKLVENAANDPIYKPSLHCAQILFPPPPPVPRQIWVQSPHTSTGYFTSTATTRAHLTTSRPAWSPGPRERCTPGPATSAFSGGQTAWPPMEVGRAGGRGGGVFGCVSGSRDFSQKDFTRLQVRRCNAESSNLLTGFFIH